MKKILVTGSAGMLGKDIIKVLSSNFDVYGFDKFINKNFTETKQVIEDLTNFKCLSKTLNNIDPSIIIHSAAIVNIDLCEKNKEIADTMHYKVTDVLSSYKPDKTKFIYISSDSVFDGKKGNYYEEDKPTPINYYAKSKLKGEKITLNNNNNSIICRTNIYGFKEPKGNSLAEWAIDNLNKSNSIKGFTDIIFNPLYTKQLARIINDLILQNTYIGILNAVSNKPISKYDFLIKLANEFDFSTNLIEKSSSHEFNFSVPRPKNTSLSSSKLKKLFPSEEYSIEKGLKNLKKDC